MVTETEPDKKLSNFVETIKSNGGIVLAAFIGVANFIGISSGEIPNILRNDDAAADLAGALIVLALLAALASSLLPNRDFWFWWLVPIWLAVAALTFLPRLLIKLPNANPWSFILAIICLVFLAIAVLALPIILGIVRYNLREQLDGKDKAAVQSRPESEEASQPRSGDEEAAQPQPEPQPLPLPQTGWMKIWLYKLNYRVPLLVTAIVLSLVASYSGLRAEAASQSESTRPQLASKLTLDDTGYSLEVTVNISRLPGDNRITVAIYAWPAPKMAGKAPAPAPVECTESQCDCKSDGCVDIGSAQYGPDQNGNLNATYNVIFPKDSYTNIEIISVHSSPQHTSCYRGTATFCYTRMKLVLT